MKVNEMASVKLSKNDGTEFNVYLKEDYVEEFEKFENGEEISVQFLIPAEDKAWEGLRGTNAYKSDTYEDLVAFYIMGTGKDFAEVCMHVERQEHKLRTLNTTFSGEISFTVDKEKTDVVEEVESYLKSKGFSSLKRDYTNISPEDGARLVFVGNKQKLKSLNAF